MPMDLMCNEVNVLSSSNSSSYANSNVSSPLMCGEESPQGEDVFLGVDLQETINLSLAKEILLAQKKNAQYLDTVQRHGMEASWRRKISHWMFETAKAFDLTKDTVGCAISFMDQYLSVLSVDKIMLQLLSMVCMYVASKMHESHPITMEEMDLLSQRKFRREDIRKVEAQLLQVIEWQLNPPTCFTFARDFMRLLDMQQDHELLEAIVELLQDATEDYNSVRFYSSSLAIASIHVMWNARKMRRTAFVKDAIRSLDLYANESIDCYRFVLEIYRAKYQQHPRFMSVEESKSEPVRSNSPTSVDDPASVVCASSSSRASSSAPTTPSEAFVAANSTSIVVSGVSVTVQEGGPNAAKRARTSL